MTTLKPKFALQVVNTVAPGGIEAAAAHYAAMFRENGIETACLYRGPAGAMLEAAGVRVIQAPSLIFSPLARIAPKVFLSGGLLGAEPELIVVHSDRGLPAMRRLFPDAKIITPCHSDKAKHKGDADLVVTLNDRQTDIVKAQLTQTKTPVARLGNPYIPQTHTASNDDGRPRRVGFCARFTPVKDPLTFIRAVGRLTDLEHVEFVLAGNGPIGDDVDAAIQAAGLESHITRPGWLSPPWTMFEAGDTIVLPSSWEGLPYLIQEALDRHVNIIAADNAGNTTALRDGEYGDLFPFGDEAALAGLIRRTCATPDTLAAKTQKGRENLATEYGAKGFWNRLSEALENTASAR